MAVRTRVIASGVTNGGVQLVFTCPSGRTAIVKWVQAEFQMLGVNQQFRLLKADGVQTSTIAGFIGTLGSRFQQQTYAVLEPGDQLIANGTVAGQNWSADGVLLFGAPS